MSDCWALDIAREEELVIPAPPDAVSSSYGNSLMISSAGYLHTRPKHSEYYGQPNASDDGYDTACSPEVSSERVGENQMRGRKRKRLDNEDEKRKKLKKNDDQRSRKREEKYYMDALKGVFIENGFITTTTPKRAITHFETLKIARMKIESFINEGVRKNRMREVCDHALQIKT